MLRRFPRPLQAYILTVIAGGGIVLFADFPWQIETADLLLFATLAVSGVLAGMYQLPLMERHLRISLTGSILLMAVFLTTTPVASLLAALVSILSGLALRRRPWNVAFTAGSNVLCVGLAATLYHRLADPPLLPLGSWTNVLALYLSASAYWLTSSALVTVLVAANSRQSFLRTYITNWREVYLQCILLTLLAVLGAAAWHQGAVYAFLLFVPAVAVYQLLSITQLKQEQATHAIETIAEVLDRRNPFTFQHSQRVAEHTAKIAKQIGLRDGEVGALRRAALIHDLGKLGVDDPSEELLPTQGDLTDYQFYGLKQHAQMGAMIAREIPAFEESEESIRYHHDWYDGSHVSRDHSGDAIPLGARILAVADSYDRLCMANGEATLTYDPMAVEQLKAMGGRQLDPRLLACFLGLLASEQTTQSSTVQLPHPPKPAVS